MDEFDKLLLGKAGIKLPIEKASVPRNQNKGKPIDSVNRRPDDKNNHDAKLPKIIRNGENGKYQDIKIDRHGTPGVETEHKALRHGEEGTYSEIEYSEHNVEHEYQDIHPERTGTPGEVTDLRVARQGKNGVHKDDIKVTRTGRDGIKRNDISSPRTGKEGTPNNDISAPRTGKEGTPNNDISAPRTGKDGKETDVNIVRGGDMGSPTDISIFRAGLKGKDTEIPLPKRGGTNGKLDEGSKIPIPLDANPTAVNHHNPKVLKLLRQITGLDEMTDLQLDQLSQNLERTISNVTGINQDFTNYTQASYWLKKLLGGVGKALGPQVDGLEDIMGFTPTNSDIIAYYKHLMTNPWNLARIPLDLAMRVVGIPGQIYARKLDRLLFTGEEVAGPTGGQAGNAVNNAVAGGIEKLSGKLFGVKSIREIKNIAFSAMHATIMQYSAHNQNLNSDVIKGGSQIGQKALFAKDPDYENNANFMGYEFNAGQLIETTRKISDILNRHGFSSKKNNSLTNDYKLLGSKENFFQGNRDLWKTMDGTTFEMADNFYWGVKIVPYNGVHKCLLPKFPDEFSHGWWPVISCSYTKFSLTSHAFQVPYFTLEIPIKGERPSKMRLTMIDNAKRSIQYWLEDYAKRCFDIDNNIVLPYKNICFHITVYRYDCTLATLYKGDYLCVLSNPNLPFNGETTHNTNEIDLNFEIVGEYPANFQSPLTYEDKGDGSYEAVSGLQLSSKK